MSESTLIPRRRLSKILDHIAVVNNNLNTCNTSKLTKLSNIYPQTASKFKSIFSDRYIESDEILLKHGREVIGGARSFPPTAVIYPLSTNEISQLLSICNNHSPPINIMPYAAGSSLESHILPINSPNQNNRIAITVNCTKMDHILNIYPSDMQCVVEPGVNWVNLNKKLSKYNLFIGVDPSPSACIGGMCGTNCSGPSALKHGTMRNQIINMTIVLSNGKIIKTGQRAVKSVAGYDLNSLFCGSEGTFGMITKITLRLRPVPKYIEIAQACFDNMESIGKCVKEINKCGINLAAFEYLDPIMVNNCKSYDKKVDIILNKHIIMFKFVGPTKQHINADIKLIKNIVNKYTKYPFKFSKNESDRERLWKVRKMAFWAAKFANPNKECIITDVAVPFSNFNKSLISCKKELDKSWLNAPIVGHIGDGNWHSVIFFDKNSNKDINEAKRLNNFIVETALKLDGTCTAEHGIGKHKTKWLKYELGENSVEFMHSLKKHIDPNCILAPGNVVQL